VTVEPPDRPRRGALDRITSFTDAAVAIALTLLVLPLVDEARDPPPGETVWTQMAEDSGDLLAFLVSFLVIARFWTLHRRLFESLVDFDERLLSLTTLWLLFIVFLPYPTARLFVGSQTTTDAVVLYLATLVLISLVGLAQTWYVRRHPRLRLPVRDTVWRDRNASAWAAVAAFGLAIGVAFVSPFAGLLTLLLVVPLQSVAVRAARRRSARAPRE